MRVLVVWLPRTARSMAAERSVVNEGPLGPVGRRQAPGRRVPAAVAACRTSTAGLREDRERPLGATLDRERPLGATLDRERWMETDRDLLDRLRAASNRAYAPYSGFRVVAALTCEDGTVYVGVNVENRSYGLTCCAERSAVFAAVSAGRRIFRSLAIYSPDSTGPLPPCGACRQVVSEFVPVGFPVRCYAADGSYRDLTMGDLLPMDSLHELGRPGVAPRRALPG
jgi:cytidine deaminase